MVRIPREIACPVLCAYRCQGCHNDSCHRHVAQQEYLAKARAADKETAMLREDMVASGNRHRSFSGWIERPQTLRKKANKQIW